MSNSIFWCESGSRPDFVPCDVTDVLVPEEQSDGSVNMVTKVLENIDDPLAALSFDDFTIAKCLKSGVSYKSLLIQPDLRIGHEDEIEAFNARVEAMNDKLFNQSKSE